MRLAGPLMLGFFLLTMGCATVEAPVGRGAVLKHSRQRGELVVGKRLAMASPAGMAVRAVASGAVRLDDFEHLLVLAGLDDFKDLPSRGAALEPGDALRMLALLLNKPVTLGTFPPRMAVCHLLREVLGGGQVSREELVRRVKRFQGVAVLRPDGYLAWTLNGHTQQKVGTVEWTNGSFRAGPFELGRFYPVSGWVFRQADGQLSPLLEGPPLAEVYDDADYISRSLDGAQDAFVELYHAMGQLLTHPWDSLVALRRLPEGVAALLASSPEYLEHFRYMTRGEQARVLSKLTTSLILTVGTAGSTTSTLTRALGALEATVPVLSLSANGLLTVERVGVSVGNVSTALRGGPGAAILLQKANASGQKPSPAPGPGQWGPAEESMSARARAYQQQISGHTADEAYWVGGMGRNRGGVKFDGFQDGVLLEAKGPGYANKFLDNLEPQPWFKPSGAQALVEQARRQLRVAMNTGTSLRWHVAEEKVAEAIRILFERERVLGIEVVHTPAL